MNENGYPAYTNNNQHRRRIKTEEEAKVFAAVWGTELIKFLAKLSTYFPPGLFEEQDELLQEDMKNRMNSALSQNHPGEIYIQRVKKIR